MNKIFRKSEMNEIFKNFFDSQSFADMLELIGNGVEEENGIVRHLDRFTVQQGEYSVCFEKKS